MSITNIVQFFSQIKDDASLHNQKNGKAFITKYQWLHTLEKYDLSMKQNATENHKGEFTNDNSKNLEILNGSSKKSKAKLTPPKLQEIISSESDDLHINKAEAEPTSPAETQVVKAQLETNNLQTNLGIALSSSGSEELTKSESNESVVLQHIPFVEKTILNSKAHSVENKIVSDNFEKKPTQPHGETQDFKQHYISVIKIDGGYTIWARDYRAGEKDVMKKNIANLKEMIMANGGALKNVVMNGEKLK